MLNFWFHTEVMVIICSNYLFTNLKLDSSLFTKIPLLVSSMEYQLTSSHWFGCDHYINQQEWNLGFTDQ